MLPISYVAYVNVFVLSIPSNISIGSNALRA